MASTNLTTAIVFVCREYRKCRADVLDTQSIEFDRKKCVTNIYQFIQRMRTHPNRGQKMRKKTAERIAEEKELRDGVESNVYCANDTEEIRIRCTFCQYSIFIHISHLHRSTLFRIQHALRSPAASFSFLFSGSESNCALVAIIFLSMRSNNGRNIIYLFRSAAAWRIDCVEILSNRTHIE